MGAGPADAAARLVALERAGCDAEAVVLGLAGAESDDAFAHRAEPRDRVGRGPEALDRALASFRPDVVVVASALPGGGPLASRLPDSLPRVWWPTAVAAPGFAAWRGPGRPPLSLGSAAAAEVGPTAALDWAVLDAPLGGRRRLPLWDGEYVLVPVPIDGAHGADVIRGFAEISEDRDQIDLVVLGPRVAALEKLAWQLHVGTRVHFAGAAPRPAEYAWAHSAAATVITGVGPISAGVVLRALASGSPVAGVGRDGAGAIVRAWLGNGHGSNGADTPASALSRALSGGQEVEAAVSHGRTLAARHEHDVIAARLIAALRLDDAMRRAA